MSDTATCALVTALHARNAAGASFGGIIADYDALATRCLELEVGLGGGRGGRVRDGNGAFAQTHASHLPLPLQTRTHQLNKETAELRAEATDSAAAAAAARAAADRAAPAAAAELAAVYKQKAALAEEALAAARQVAVLRESNEKNAEDAQRAARDADAARADAAAARAAAQAAQDALAAAQDEMVARLAEREAAAERAATAEAEVSDLARRLVEMKATEIDRVNAVTEQCAAMLTDARAKQRSAAADAAAAAAAVRAGVGSVAGAAAAGLLDRMKGVRRSLGGGDGSGTAAEAAPDTPPPLDDNDTPAPPPPSLLPDTLTACLPPHTGGTYATAFDGAGWRLATAGGDRAVRLWDGASGAPAGALAGAVDTVTSVAFTCDRRGLLAGGVDQVREREGVGLGGGVVVGLCFFLSSLPPLPSSPPVHPLL